MIKTRHDKTRQHKTKQRAEQQWVNTRQQRDKASHLLFIYGAEKKEQSSNGVVQDKDNGIAKVMIAIDINEDIGNDENKDKGKDNDKDKDLNKGIDEDKTRQGKGKDRD